jgi:hypothetical protein
MRRIVKIGSNITRHYDEAKREFQQCLHEINGIILNSAWMAYDMIIFRGIIFRGMVLVTRLVKISRVYHDQTSH